jgi:hypothetical protein
MRRLPSLHKQLRRAFDETRGATDKTIDYYSADSETTTDNRVKQAFLITEPNHEQLIRIGDLLESGALAARLEPCQHYSFSRGHCR